MCIHFLLKCIFSNFRHLACEENHAEVAKMLVEAGASLSAKNKEEKTPLDFCTKELAKSLTELNN